MLLRVPPSANLIRPCLRSLRQPPTARGIANRTQQPSSLSKTSFRLPQRQARLAIVAYRPFTTSLIRSQDVKLDSRKFDEEKGEKMFGQEKLEPHPDEVSADSSMTPVMRQDKATGEEKIGRDEDDMLKEIKSDLRVIKEVFELKEVPREAFIIGAAGLLPYLGTSLTTAYLAWDINRADLTGQGLFLSGPQAQWLLDTIEPLQIGYGAVIISFLGAIHWGLEWAGYGGHHGFRRYAYGVIPPAIAWPTTFLSLETALITQFLAFTTMYYADSVATTNGWVPHWYGSYRFVLTFVVGASIVISLIGRGEIADMKHRLPNPMDRVERLKGMQEAEREKEEKYMQDQMLLADEEAEGEEEEGEEEEAGGDEKEEEIEEE